MTVCSQTNSEQASRFSFGKNWLSFSQHLTTERIESATKAMLAALPFESLEGKRFLDVGCGSGLSSLVARRLGAKVLSFDFDSHSVQCTLGLKKKFFPQDEGWDIQRGSVLDPLYLHQLGEFDVVYAWGLLHHTGNMWRAIRLLLPTVAPGGYLHIAVYNDQGGISTFWKAVKRIYCSGDAGAFLVKCLFIPYFFARASMVSMIRYGHPFHYFQRYQSRRGMSIYHDWIDWIGGYPFEVARPHQIREFLEEKEFQIKYERLTLRSGCNEFVFQRSADIARDLPENP